MMSWSTYVFNESTLVLEGVTLGQVVQLVVKVLVDLSGGTVLEEETAEDTETAHPDDLAIDIRVSKQSPSSSLISHKETPPSPLWSWYRDCVPWHTSVLGTLPLTETTVATNSSSGGQLPGAGLDVLARRVDGRLGAVGEQRVDDRLAVGLTGVGVGDFAGLVGVEPDLALSATDHGGREALLSAEVDPVKHAGSVF